MFNNKSIRTAWDSEKEDYYFSVVDVIGALTDNEYEKSRNYWKRLKNKLNSEGSELVSNTNRLKMKAKDGKFRDTDVLNTEGIYGGSKHEIECLFFFFLNKITYDII